MVAVHSRGQGLGLSRTEFANLLLDKKSCLESASLHALPEYSSEPSGASLEAEKEQWDEGASREQKPKMTTHGVPMAFERLVWKASAVLHFTHKH